MRVNLSKEQVCMCVHVCVCVCAVCVCMCAMCLYVCLIQQAHRIDGSVMPLNFSKGARGRWIGPDPPALLLMPVIYRACFSCLSSAPVDRPLLRLALMQATDGRDALAKDIYERLFGWLVTVINHSTAVDEFAGVSDRTMSLLDIFGFECFKVIRLLYSIGKHSASSALRYRDGLSDPSAPVHCLVIYCMNCLCLVSPWYGVHCTVFLCNPLRYPLLNISLDYMRLVKCLLQLSIWWLHVFADWLGRWLLWLNSYTC